MIHIITKIKKKTETISEFLIIGPQASGSASQRADIRMCSLYSTGTLECVLNRDRGDIRMCSLLWRCLTDSGQGVPANFRILPQDFPGPHCRGNPEIREIWPELLIHSLPQRLLETVTTAIYIYIYIYIYEPSTLNTKPETLNLKP